MQDVRPVVATILVAGSETYRILLTDPEHIAIAQRLLAGDEAPGIPNGLIRYDGDGGVNTGFAWHIDPTDLEWADGAIEICDGLPSAVGTPNFTSDRYCPWLAKVVAIEPTDS
jgi:hypothetical protein